jgi:hypothetical protein
MIDFSKIGDGINRAFKALASFAMNGGTAAISVALIAIVVGIMMEKVGDGTISVPSAINTSIQEFATGFQNLVGYLADAYGIAGALVILALVVIIFGVIWQKKKSKSTRSGSDYLGE